MTQKFDAIVIGTGQSGPSVADRMDDEGMKVAVIERNLFGGTCVNVGCVPTKTLVASARVAHVARPGISQNPLSSPAAAGGLMCEEYKINARNGEISSSTFPSIS